MARERRGSTRRRPPQRPRTRRPRDGRGRRPAPPRRPSRAPWVVVGVVVLGAIGAAAWWMLTAEESGGEPLAACAVVIDRSASVSGASVDSLSVAVETAFDQCATRDAALALYTVDEAGAGFRRAGEWDLFPDAFRTGTRLSESREEKVEAAREAMEAALAGAGTQDAGAGSNVLRAMDEAGVYLQQLARRPSVRSSHLVVLSDGLQASSGVSVESLVGDEVDDDGLVEQARQSGLLPDLEGVNVVMAGVGAGETATGDPLPDAFTARLREFWTAIIAATGGSLCAPPVAETPPDLVQECV